MSKSAYCHLMTDITYKGPRGALCVIFLALEFRTLARRIECLINIPIGKYLPRCVCVCMWACMYVYRDETVEMWAQYFVVHQGECLANAHNLVGPSWMETGECRQRGHLVNGRGFVSMATSPLQNQSGHPQLPVHLSTSLISSEYLFIHLTRLTLDAEGQPPPL